VLVELDLFEHLVDEFLLAFWGHAGV